MLAFAMMAVIRHRANTGPLLKNATAAATDASVLIRWSIQESGALP